MLTSDSIFETIPGSDVRVCFGSGKLEQLGEIAAAEGAGRVLLVTDAGVLAAGHAERGADSLRRARLEVVMFSGAEENPSTQHVDSGLAVARAHRVDFIVGLGGGSSMDCAKGINFLYTNGGQMKDYWGVNKAGKPMLPLVAVPTTAGTGSEAQSFALITDPVTHEKMACGDLKALPRVAILDPDLMATCPTGVAAATGIDAISHAVETSGCRVRTDVSRQLSRDAWARLQALPEVLKDAGAPAAERMLMGAHLAGAAIQNSMLGAAHACANPLTAKYGIVHGVAVGLMLADVVAFNSERGDFYADLDADAGRLVRRIEALTVAAKIGGALQAFGVRDGDLRELADAAARQWTGTFNPCPVGAAEFLEIYRRAWKKA